MRVDSFIYDIKCPNEFIMNLSDIQGNSLIISIALTLLVGAIIVYYLNTRIVSVENALARQNTILTEFIANIRNEFAGPVVSMTSGPASNDATSEAKLAAEAFLNNPQDKIDVSDDSESSDSESESDSDSDSDDEDANENVDGGGVKIIDLNSEPKEKEPFISEITDLNEDKDVDANVNTSELETIKTISLVHTDDVDSLQVQTNSDIDSHPDTDSDSESDNDADNEKAQEVVEPITQVKKEISLEDVDILPEETSSGLDVHQLFTKHLEPTNVTAESNTNMNYQKMKVDELRTLAKEGNLGNEEEIGKMKKKDLVGLLTSNA